MLFIFHYFCKMKFITTPPSNANKARKQVASQDSKNDDKKPAAVSTCKKSRKEVKRAILKELVEPVESPVNSKDLTERLLDAGLTTKEVRSIVTQKKKQERKQKFERLVHEDSQKTITQCFREEHEKTAPYIPLVAVTDVLTQYSQSQSDNDPNKSDCSSVYEYERTPERFKQKGGSTSDSATLVKSGIASSKKVAYYDLTDGVENEEDSSELDEDHDDHLTPCKDCGCRDCHDDIFGDYCFATVQRYFREDKFLAFRLQAERVFVRSYNNILDVYLFQSQKVLASPLVDVWPPKCMVENSMQKTLQWFDTEKQGYRTQFRPAQVAVKQETFEKHKTSIKKAELTWVEHEERVHKRKYGGTL